MIILVDYHYIIYSCFSSLMPGSVATMHVPEISSKDSSFLILSYHYHTFSFYSFFPFYQFMKLAMLLNTFVWSIPTRSNTSWAISLLFNALEFPLNLKLKQVLNFASRPSADLTGTLPPEEPVTYTTSPN